MTEERLFPDGSRVDDLELSGVHFHGANLEGTRFTDASLRDADISGYIEGLRIRRWLTWSACRVSCRRRNGRASVTRCSLPRRRPPANSTPLPPNGAAFRWSASTTRSTSSKPLTGPKRLLDFFDGRQQLAIYQFMDNGPDAFCPGCTHFTTT
jgi:hypothetical protein